MIANFVSTLDGVISYDLPGQRGGGPISGESEADHAIMGLLRASADAVIFGAKSLSEDSGHVRTPAFIYPPLAAAWAELRANQGQPALPLNVVVSGSGAVDLNEPNFHHPGLRVLIATTNAGAARLAQQELPDEVTALVVEGVSGWPCRAWPIARRAPARLRRAARAARGRPQPLHLVPARGLPG